MEVKAKCDYGSGGQGFGLGYLYCKLSTKCDNGYKKTADYDGIFGGMTLGLLPIGKTSFSASFSKVWSLNHMSGASTIGAATASLLGGVSIGSVCLGHHCSDGVSNIYGDIAPTEGWDISVDIFIGNGWVSNIKEECCP
jgi:hypothetical protein